MSNAVVPFTQHQALQAAEDMKAIVADNFSDGGGVAFRDLTRFKLGAGGATLFTRAGMGLDGKPEEEHVKSFRAIVIERRSQRAYWPVAYGDGGNPRPDCKSVDGVWGEGDNGRGKGRHECATCPHNQFGSRTKKNGQAGAGKACREVRVFFMIADGADGLFPSVMIVPPGSLGNLTRYAAALTNQRKSFSTGVHTFALEKAKSSDGTDFAVLRLAYDRDQTPEERAEVQRYYEAMAPLLRRFYEQSAAEAPEAVERDESTPPARVEEAQAAPADDFMGDFEYEIVEPTKKAKRGTLAEHRDEMFPDPLGDHRDPA